MAGDHAVWSFCKECKKKYEAALSEKEKECERLREALKDTEHHGHAIWCDAIKGPEHENWYREEECSCKLKQALEGKQ